MVAISQFEDIETWKEARVLTSEIYRHTTKAPFSKDYGLRNQIQTAAVSIMANIAEGFDSGSTREFRRFLGYARRSSSEVRSHLYVALDQKYLTPAEFDRLLRRCISAKSLICGFIRYLQGAAAHARTSKPDKPRTSNLNPEP
jgi:four helix bundle protein